MPNVNHINYADANGNVYCCLRNKVVQLDETQFTSYCFGCKMFGGTAQGQGVECFWDDARQVNNPHIVNDPIGEFNHNQTRKIRFLTQLPEVQP